MPKAFSMASSHPPLATLGTGYQSVDKRRGHSCFLNCRSISSAVPYAPGGPRPRAGRLPGAGAGKLFRPRTRCGHGEPHVAGRSAIGDSLAEEYRTEAAERTPGCWSSGPNEGLAPGGRLRGGTSASILSIVGECGIALARWVTTRED